MARIDCCSAPYNCAPGASGATNRTGLQAAVTAAAAYDELYFATGGTYNFDKPVGSIGVDFSGKADITLTLNGVVIRMDGDAGGSGATWRGVMLANCSGIRVVGGTFSQATVSNFGEQCHMIQVGDGTATVRDVEFDNVRFENGAGGDGIRIIGDGSTNTVEDVSITSCTFLECDRSAISIQRGVQNIVIANNTFRGTGDQSIDFEPTSAGPIGYFAITGNVINNTAGTGIQVSLSGYSDSSKNTASVFSGNVINNGVVYSGNLIRCQFSNNTITSGSRCTTSEASMHFLRRVSGVTVIGNTIHRLAASTAGACIKFTQNNGEDPHNFSIQSNICTQETLAKIIELDGCYSYQVQNNGLISDVSTANTVEGIYSFASTVQTENYIISGNRMANLDAAANAVVHCRAYTPGSIEHGTGLIDTNLGENVRYGILGSDSAINHILPTVSKNYVDSGTLYAGAFTSLENDGSGGGGGLPGGVTLTAGITIDGSGGNVVLQGPIRIITGTGSPSAEVQDAGTIYIRTDSPQLWMKEANGWRQFN